MPLNGLLACLFVVYRWRSFNAELEEGDSAFRGSLTECYVNIALKTFVPLILLLVFVNTVALKYFGVGLIG